MASENPYQSPQADCGPVPARPRRSLWWLLFSFQGRISRRTFWSAQLLSWLVMYAIVFLSIWISGTMAGVRRNEVSLFDVVGISLEPVFLWIFLAVQVKRWHDQDKSGWLALLSFVPLVGIVAFAVAGCFRGTVGPNQYGEDPA